MTDDGILAALPIWRGKPELTRLHEGRTNHNYIIKDDAGRYFGRAGIDLPHHGVFRANEKICAELAAERGVAPRVHYAENGILITEFIEGETLKPPRMHDAAILRDIASLLRKLHEKPVSGVTLIPRCGIRVSLNYLEGLPDGDLPVARQKIIARMGPSSQGGDCLVHSDIIPENFMRAKDALYLIDWEYGGSGVPEIDLASVIANADLTPSENALLLEAYGPHDSDMVERQRVALVIREAMWCLTQMRHSGPSGDLVPYTELCVARMMKEFA
ncbi:choline/ethanolamine kinase family protein [Aestuariivirga sp.]|uniref:choline/ethanolamine kinase family protein n=1 Tax=Aestuariivirga sp. TaxID=2650926 RepID=UPI0039E5F2CF